MEEVGELINGEDAFGVVLLHEPRRHPVQQAEVVFLLGLAVARVAERTGRAVLVQDDGWRLLARVFGPCLQNRDDGLHLLTLLGQIEATCLAIGANDCPGDREVVLQPPKDVPQICERDDLGVFDAMGANDLNRLVAVLPRCRRLSCPLKGITTGFQSIRGEHNVDENLPVTREVKWARDDNCVGDLQQAVAMGPTVLLFLFFNEGHVFVRVPLGFAPEKEECLPGAE